MLDLGGSLLEHGSNHAAVHSVSSEVDRLVQAVADAASKELPEALDQQVDKLSKAIDEHFDDKRVDSVQRQIVELVRGTSAEQRRSLVQGMLDDHGPLGVLKAELVGKLSVMAARQDELVRHVTAVSERLAAAEALNVEREHGTAKGVNYEAAVAAAVDWTLAPYEDTVLEVGRETGMDGNKAGDIVAVLNPRDTHGQDVRIVVEAKCRKLGIKSALTEVDRAIENREAEAGIMVFSRHDQAPLNGHSLRVYAENRIVCVFEREGDDRLPLEIACQLARTLALSGVEDADSSMDAAAVCDHVRSLTAIIDDARSIKRGANAARKGLDTVDAGYERLRAEALEVLTDLASQLG